MLRMMTFEKWVELLRLTESEVQAAEAQSATTGTATAATAKRARSTSNDEQQGQNIPLCRTNTQPFTALLDFVQDHPVEPAPER